MRFASLLRDLGDRPLKSHRGAVGQFFNLPRGPNRVSFHEPHLGDTLHKAVERGLSQFSSPKAYPITTASAWWLNFELDHRRSAVQNYISQLLHCGLLLQMHLKVLLDTGPVSKSSNQRGPINENRAGCATLRMRSPLSIWGYGACRIVAYGGIGPPRPRCHSVCERRFPDDCPSGPSLQESFAAGFELRGPVGASPGNAGPGLQ